MRRKIVAGNWKMNGNKASIEALLRGILSAQDDFGAAECVVFPPALYLDFIQQECKNSDLAWGAQNVSEHDEGAFTGEISAAMLTDFGCRYALLMHSERRQFYHETDDVAGKKFVKAVASGLSPILCMGETLAEREQGQTAEVVGHQLAAVIKHAGIDAFEKAVLAYEPVWAIGTGVTATPAQAEEVHLFVRQTLAEYSQALAESVPIIYGGSVKPSNARDLFGMPNIDGALVGGASLQANDFVDIIRCIN
jgi:triosephosphate isomerase (TIM)